MLFIFEVKVEYEKDRKQLAIHNKQLTHVGQQYIISYL